VESEPQAALGERVPEQLNKTTRAGKLTPTSSVADIVAGSWTSTLSVADVVAGSERDYQKNAKSYGPSKLWFRKAGSTPQGYSDQTDGLLYSVTVGRPQTLVKLGR
jgi:hypothetical protein